MCFFRFPPSLTMMITHCTYWTPLALGGRMSWGTWSGLRSIDRKSACSDAPALSVIVVAFVYRLPIPITLALNLSRVVFSFTEARPPPGWSGTSQTVIVCSGSDTVRITLSLRAHMFLVSSQAHSDLVYEETTDSTLFCTYGVPEGDHIMYSCYFRNRLWKFGFQFWIFLVSILTHITFIMESYDNMRLFLRYLLLRWNSGYIGLISWHLLFVRFRMLVLTAMTCIRHL